MNDLEKKSIECLKNMPIEETTYQVARNVVLDYITNLEQENERLKEERQNINNRNCNQRMTNKKLMEDIERLRTNLKTHKRRRKKQTHKKNIYKSRIDKAVEYIKERVGNEIHDMMYVIDVSDVLDILTGGDE